MTQFERDFLHEQACKAVKYHQKWNAACEGGELLLLKYGVNEDLFNEFSLEAKSGEELYKQIEAAIEEARNG